MGIFKYLNLLTIVWLGGCKTSKLQNFQNLEKISSPQQASSHNVAVITKESLPYDENLPIVFIPLNMRDEKYAEFSLSEAFHASFVRDIIADALKYRHEVPLTVKPSLASEIKTTVATDREAQLSQVPTLPREEISQDAAQALVDEQPVARIKDEEHGEVQVLFTDKVKHIKICTATEATETIGFKEFTSQAERDEFRARLAKSNNAGILDNYKKIREQYSPLLQRIGELHQKSRLDKAESAEKETLSQEIKKIKRSLAVIEPVRIAHELGKITAAQPTGYTIIDGEKFYVSKIILGNKNSDRKIAVMYTPNKDGYLMARLLYKSKSDGDWRVTYQKVMGSYSKGAGIHYTQETKLNREILALLAQLEKNPLSSTEAALVDNVFKADLSIADALEQLFAEEVHPLVLSPEVSEAMQLLQSYKPGLFASNSQDKTKIFGLPAEINESLQDTRLAAFIPVFSRQKPLQVYHFTHSLLGETKVEVYQGILDGKEVNWHMASDKEGRIWVERIALADGTTGSYGVLNEFIDSGILTNKPLEYASQSKALEGLEYPGSSPERTSPGRSFFTPQAFSRDPYFDITGFIDQLLPIQQYRAARYISRKEESTP